MFKATLLSLVILTAASSAFAQMNPKQAEAKVAEKKASEAAAATQPSDLTNAQVYQLRETIVQLQAQNAKLASTVATLQQQLQTLQQANQAAAANFWGQDEARVGMTMDDLKRLPNVGIDLISEDTTGSLYKVCTGKIDDYADRTVDDLPSSTLGPQSHVEKVAVGSHPARVQRVLIDATTGKVVEVKLDGDQ